MADHDPGRQVTWIPLPRAAAFKFPTVKFPATVEKNCYKKMAEKAAERQLALKNKKKNGKGKAQSANSPSASTVERANDNWVDLTQSAGQVSGSTHKWELEIGGNVFASSYSMLSEEAVTDPSTLHFYYNKNDQTRLTTPEKALDLTKEGKFARLDHYFDVHNFNEFTVRAYKRVIKNETDHYVFWDEAYQFLLSARRKLGQQDNQWTVCQQRLHNKNVEKMTEHTKLNMITVEEFKKQVEEHNVDRFKITIVPDAIQMATTQIAIDDPCAVVYTFVSTVKVMDTSQAVLRIVLDAISGIDWREVNLFSDPNFADFDDTMHRTLYSVTNCSDGKMIACETFEIYFRAMRTIRHWEFLLKADFDYLHKGMPFDALIPFDSHIEVGAHHDLTNYVKTNKAEIPVWLSRISIIGAYFSSYVKRSQKFDGRVFELMIEALFCKMPLEERDNHEQMMNSMYNDWVNINEKRGTKPFFVGLDPIITTNLNVHYDFDDKFQNNSEPCECPMWKTRATRGFCDIKRKDEQLAEEIAKTIRLLSKIEELEKWKRDCLKKENSELTNSLRIIRELEKENKTHVEELIRLNNLLKDTAILLDSRAIESNVMIGAECKEELKTLREQLDAIVQEKAEGDRAIAEHATKLFHFMEALTEVENERNVFKKQCEELKEKNECETNENAILKERIRMLEKQMAVLEKEKETDKGQLKLMETQLLLEKNESLLKNAQIQKDIDFSNQMRQSDAQRSMELQKINLENEHLKDICERLEDEKKKEILEKLKLEREMKRMEYEMQEMAKWEDPQSAHSSNYRQTEMQWSMELQKVNLDNEHLRDICKRLENEKEKEIREKLNLQRMVQRMEFEMRPSFSTQEPGTNGFQHRFSNVPVPPFIPPSMNSSPPINRPSSSGPNQADVYHGHYFNQAPVLTSHQPMNPFVESNTDYSAARATLPSPIANKAENLEEFIEIFKRLGQDSHENAPPVSPHTAQQNGFIAGFGLTARDHEVWGPQNF
ncbi:hypothetical protein L5515_017988 [Caenorhabditis briggsae]|uniref:Uncharacterized protein n=1 Tax=Caenorhabditis briggsae TaxID=6238 RepID=A0AAE9FFA4_CAEBR|nr:hypothetical protein L5515_017988 [Caenorhabditis briggsae]